MARAAERSQFVANLPVPESGRLSVWPSTRKHPRNVGWDIRGDLFHRGRDLVEFGHALGFEIGLAGIEEHLGLEHEAVADDADIGAIAEDISQAAKEIGAIARKLLDLLGERDVQPRSEIGDSRLCVLFAGLRRLERGFDRRELATQGRDLLVERIDLRQRLRGVRQLGVERSL